MAIARKEENGKVGGVEACGGRGCMTTDSGGTTPLGVGTRQIVVHAPVGSPDQGPGMARRKEWSHVWGTGRLDPRD